jgi:hypothetical protein
MLLCCDLSGHPMSSRGWYQRMSSVTGCQGSTVNPDWGYCKLLDMVFHIITPCMALMTWMSWHIHVWVDIHCHSWQQKLTYCEDNGDQDKYSLYYGCYDMNLSSGSWIEGTGDCGYLTTQIWWWAQRKIGWDVNETSAHLSLRQWCNYTPQPIVVESHGVHVRVILTMTLRTGGSSTTSRLTFCQSCHWIVQTGHT